MSQATWLARPKKNAVNEVYKIDEEYNRVPGHKTPEAHIRSVFEHVIPKIAYNRLDFDRPKLVEVRSLRRLLRLRFMGLLPM